MAIVTAGGSALSHSAILARSLHLPLVVGARAGAAARSTTATCWWSTARSGQLIVEPDADDLRALPRAHARAGARAPAAAPPAPRAHAHARRRRHQAATPTPNRATTSPRRTRCGAAGVGPVSHRVPVPAAQRTAGRGRAVPRLPRRRAGHDRPHGHHPHARPRRRQGRPHRPGAATTNPIPRSACAACACRWRAPALFDTQLRAILRASGYGPVRVLVPMVSSREEMRRGAQHCSSACARELRSEGHESRRARRRSAR